MDADLPAPQTRNRGANVYQQQPERAGSEDVHHSPEVPLLQDLGKTREKVLEECREREPEMRKLAYLLMDNFLGLVEE